MSTRKEAKELSYHTLQRSSTSLNDYDECTYFLKVFFHILFRPPVAASSQANYTGHLYHHGRQFGIRELDVMRTRN